MLPVTCSKTCYLPTEPTVDSKPWIHCRGCRNCRNAPIVEYVKQTKPTYGGEIFLTEDVETEDEKDSFCFGNRWRLKADKIIRNK